MTAHIGKAFARHDFHNVAQIHDRHLMGKGFDQADIVTDKSDSDILLPLQAGNQFNDRFLYGNVQRAGGFVHDDELRFQCNGPGDCHTLALAAGHVMGEPVRKISGQFYQFQQLTRFCVHF